MWFETLLWLIVLVITCLHWTSGTICIRTRLAPSINNDGHIKSPRYPLQYPANVCRIWIYMGDPGMHLTVKFIHLDIPSEGDKCAQDVLIIGPKNERMYCGNSALQYFPPYEVQMHGENEHHFFIVFNSTNSVHKGQGFDIYYRITFPLTPSHTTPSTPEIITPDCSHNLTQSTGEFGMSNGNLPRSCSWYLHTPVTTAQNIMYYLHVQLSYFLANDSLKIYDGLSTSSHLIAKLHESRRLSYEYTSSGNAVLVTFVTDGSLRRRSPLFGFKITYTTSLLYCPEGHLHCGYGEHACYPRVKRCDCLWDCPLHGGDERGCTDGKDNQCGHDKFSCCSSPMNCYSESDRCNGKGACSNYMDERGCTSDRCNATKGLFLCKNKRCIYEKWQCDGTNDCQDKSDEDSSNCNIIVSNRVIVAAAVGSLLCTLLLVIAFGCLCKVYRVRMHQHLGPSHHETPLTRLQAEMFRRRAPPPPYHEAMTTSRPYEEAFLELLSQIQEAEGRASGVGGENQDGQSPESMSNLSSEPLTGSRLRDLSVSMSRRVRRHRRRGREHRLSPAGTATGSLGMSAPPYEPLYELGEENFLNGSTRENSAHFDVEEGTENPPPYTENESYHHDVLTSFTDSEGEDFSETEEWERQDRHNDNAEEDIPGMTPDGGSTLQMGVITPQVNGEHRVSLSTATASMNCHSTDITSNMSNPKDSTTTYTTDTGVSNKTEGQDNNTAGTSLSADATNSIAGVGNKEEQDPLAEEEDSDVECILSDNINKEAGDSNSDEDADSDTLCLLSSQQSRH